MRRPARGHDRRARCPRSSAPTAIAALTVPPNDPSALAIAIGRLLDDPELRARIGAAGRDRVLDRFTWRKSAEGMIENWYALLEERERTSMLTVDFDRLGLQPGDRLLDMGCGGGRHAFAGLRRGATVVAFDYSEGELKDVRGVVGAMSRPASSRRAPSGAPSTATRSTSRSPTTRST